MNRGTTALSKAYRGTSVISKIYRGTTLLWEYWLLNTGNLVYMTSDTAPSPYVASALSTPTSGSAYFAFDNNDANNVTWNYGSGTASVKMVWTNLIRLSKLRARVSRSGQTNTLFRIYGIKSDDSEIKICELTHTNDSSIVVDSTDKTTAFKGVRIEIDRRSDLIVAINHLRVEEWYSTT